MQFKCDIEDILEKSAESKGKCIFEWERKLHESEQVNCENDICNQIKIKCIIFNGN